MIRSFARIVCVDLSCGNSASRIPSGLNWPIDVADLPVRFIAGPAKIFVHNVGKFEVEDRKSSLLYSGRVSARKKSKCFLGRAFPKSPYRIEDHRIQHLVSNLPNCHDLCREGDVLIQASKAEGIGLSVLEGIACGLPVLTTNCPPLDEYIRDSGALVSTHWGKRLSAVRLYFAGAPQNPPSGPSRQTHRVVRHRMT